jgi:hypothetical protein
MMKILLSPLLLLLGCLIAGIYGALHNQISYTVSPDYFHEFKYLQFRLDPYLPGRLGASIVGWMASWWMGGIIGFVLIPVGCVLPEPRTFFFGVLKAFGVAAITALVIGLGALIVACVTLDSASVGEIVRYRNKISNPLEFARAGTMHNFSYLGGLVGIITGVVSIFVERKRVRLDSESLPK